MKGYNALHYSRLIVTGTDTDVGKTFVTAALVRHAIQGGLEARGFKLVETGVGIDGPRDAHELWEAAGRPTQTAAPWVGATYPLPAAPTVAARAARRPLDLESVLQRLAGHEGHPILLAEGAGGLLVPFTDTMLFADVAARIGWPLLIVARARLGTLNHTLLTLREAERRGLPIAAIVLVASSPDPIDGAAPGKGPIDFPGSSVSNAGDRAPKERNAAGFSSNVVSNESHVDELRRWTHVPVFGPVPYLPAGFTGAQASAALAATGLPEHLWRTPPQHDQVK